MNREKRQAIISLSIFRLYSPRMHQYKSEKERERARARKSEREREAESERGWERGREGGREGGRKKDEGSMREGGRERETEKERGREREGGGGGRERAYRLWGLWGLKFAPNRVTAPSSLSRSPLSLIVPSSLRTRSLSSLRSGDSVASRPFASVSLRSLALSLYIYR
jgi:hypothetical protein